MRTSTLSRSPGARPGRRSRLVSVPVTGAAALALVLTGCGAEQEEDGITAVDIYNEEFEVLAEDAGVVQEESDVLEVEEPVEAGDVGAVAPGAFVAGGVGIPALLIAADPQAALAGLADEPAVATEVPVFAVPTDEGFWIGTEEVRIWVQLTAPGESPVNVEPGDRVSFTGEVVPNADGFVEGLSLPADQAAALTDLGYHVDVPAGAITIA
ncbi:hypothetical protein O2V63_12900 [Modestobacter sp. VKM Ac-2977]|uniref:hypothetical protein n=1 Tax=Modestobacter sp. VKM Ac-2977 TaxID=3004131 RepID=UPI0022AAB2D3|nr:hypothetical protein [Modestobacter sp. VKM Ac-2977]MCZ2821235.1 hypothetical protein [Modestobacter sp. VKM Ac-2977]